MIRHRTRSSEFWAQFLFASAIVNKLLDFREEYLRYACEIVEEYVPEILKKKLFEFFGLPFVQEKLNKRKSELDGSDPDASNAKKLKVADVNVQPTEDYGTSTPSNLNNVVCDKTISNL